MEGRDGCWISFLLIEANYRERVQFNEYRFSLLKSILLSHVTFACVCMLTWVVLYASDAYVVLQSKNIFIDKTFPLR